MQTKDLYRGVQTAVEVFLLYRSVGDIRNCLPRRFVNKAAKYQEEKEHGEFVSFF